MIRPLAGVRAAVLVLVGVEACSVLYPASGYDDGPPLPDVGADGGGDGPGSRTNADADPDEGDDAGIDAAPFRCRDLPAPVVFCDDFDERQLERVGGWTVTTANGVTLVLDASAPRSPPASLSVTLPATSTGSDLRGDIRHTEAVPGTSAWRTEFDLRVEGDTRSGVVPMLVEVENPDGGATNHVDISMVVSSGGTAFEEFVRYSAGSTSNTYPLSGDVPRGRWTRIACVLKSSPPLLRVFVDGMKVLDQGLSAEWANVLLDQATVTILLGVHATRESPVPGVRVAIDGVSFVNN
jgi:hypothetical protein